jgi:hypothetical protein
MCSIEVKCLHVGMHLHCACGKIDACIVCVSWAERKAKTISIF